MCIICKKSNDRVILLSTKARKTLIASNVERKDALARECENLSRVYVHSICRNKYTKPQLIRKAAKEAEQQVNIFFFFINAVL